MRRPKNQRNRYLFIRRYLDINKEVGYVLEDLEFSQGQVKVLCSAELKGRHSCLDELLGPFNCLR